MTSTHPSPIPLVAQLAGALREAGVRYCHWKSTASIELAERGESDLDLLVARGHVREFNRVVSSCGFIAAHRQHAAPIPGVSDFFGYDATVDRFVHVHAHYQLVLGHDRTKNYHLPIEEPYLASASTPRVFPTPSPEFEYVVFVIRMVLKYAVLDEILWNAARGRRAGPKPSERREFDRLREAIEPDVVATILREHLPFIEPRLFVAAERVAMGGAPIWQRVAVAGSMKKALEAHSRSAPSVGVLLRIWRRAVLLVRRRMGAKPGYRLTSGGAIIAVMGGDGAGKTTALGEIGDWLERHFDVTRVHLGKPPWTWTTYAVRGGLKAVSTVASHFNGSDGSPSLWEDGGGTVSEYRRMLWFACKARDRYLAYRKARRAANRGSIVISDRFPHPALHLMDSPQIAQLTEGDACTGAVRRLIRLENRYHSRVPPPDVAFVLRLDPHEAARRKTDERYEYVVERAAEIWDIDWSDTLVHVIDASGSPQTVAAEMKQIIWGALT